MKESSSGHTRIFLLLFLSYSFLVSIAITTIDWSRWYMLHMAVVLEGTIFILTLDVTVNVLHEKLFIQ